MLFFERLNPFIIVKKHFETFYNAAEDNKPCWIERSLHIAVPIAIGLLITIVFNVSITAEVNSALFNGFAIMGGFLINASFVLTEKRDTARKAAPNDKYEVLIRETFYNTSFGILICFTNVIFCSLYPLTLTDKGKDPSLLNLLMNNLIYDLSILFVLTLLMVLKRLNRIFAD